MYLKANANCYITQKGVSNPNERQFKTVWYINNVEDALGLMQVTEAEKAELLKQSMVLDPDELTPEYLKDVETLIDAIPATINTKGFTDEQALENKEWFPVWGDENAPMGMEVPVGFRLRYKTEEEEEYTLYRVIQKHALQAEWVPGIDTASLYTVVSVHKGTKDDPIPYEQNMALEKDKYYTQDGVLYVCILTTETGYPYDLKDMPTIVQPVTEEETTE